MTCVYDVQGASKYSGSKFYMDIDRLPPEGMDELPVRLWPFIWFFCKQIKGLLLLKLGLEFFAALFLSGLFWYISFLASQGEFTWSVVFIGLSLLCGFLISEGLISALYHLVYTNAVGNIIRRQLYWLTARQSLSFFQNDFAGRIANKLLQSAPALRDALEIASGPAWYVAVFTVSNIVLMGMHSPWLAIVMISWLMTYVYLLLCHSPKIQFESVRHSEDMSELTGQVVDSFSNFPTIKFFAKEEQEDIRTVDLLKRHSHSMRRIGVRIFILDFWSSLSNVVMLVAMTSVCIWLVITDQKDGSVFALALPMSLQAVFQSEWIKVQISSFFENLGRVQEVMEALSKPIMIVDKPDAKDLSVTSKKANIVFDNVSFNYGKEEGMPVLDAYSLDIPAGQKVGLVGRSGAGKSTVTSLLLRAYDIADGSITIGGQNIADVTQASLRRSITIVTQDSYLFHRSILDNIRYGNPEASEQEVIRASKQANAHGFIEGLVDNKGRQGYEAHVGERGVKLSGGQRQRIAIARAFLKKAPILLLDEATSALDSESEKAIQDAFEDIMKGKTVIAIAHRLSTLRQMDRIIVMDEGKIVEDGTHDALLAQKGHYAKLWSMQSGGFLS